MKKSISNILWELIPHENKYVITEKDLLDYITNLQQENNNLKTSLDESQEVVNDLQQENQKLKSRIEKAIEYIKVNNSEWKWSMFGRDELLNILGGEDNDN